MDASRRLQRAPLKKVQIFYSCLIKLSLKPQMWYFHVIVLKRTVQICFKKRAARAARLFFLVQPIWQILNLWRCCCRWRRQCWSFYIKKTPIAGSEAFSRALRRPRRDSLRYDWLAPDWVMWPFSTICDWTNPSRTLSWHSPFYK